MRAALRGLILSALAGGLAASLLIVGARRWMPSTVHGPVAEGAWVKRSRAMFTPTGFFSAEFDDTTDRHFSWTKDQAQLEFPNLSRARAYRVTLRLRDARPASLPRPQLRIGVDGNLRLNADVASEPGQIDFEIPRRETDGAIVTIDVSPMFAPGGADPRSLGIIVDDVAVTPVNGAFRPTAAVVFAIGLAAMGLVFGLWVAGVRGQFFAPVAVLVAVGFAWLLVQDAAFAGAYPDRLLRIGLGGGAVGLVIGAFRWRWPTIGGVPEWSLAAGLVLAASTIKLGLYWHPLAIVGDALFHVHRAQVVHSGEFFFTSITPKPFFEFPYPVALYVAAQPFWNWFPAELDLVRLLRALSLAADALVGVALYAAARRQWPDRRAALFVAALWPFARAPLEALTNANLTNLFGQGVFGIALAAVAVLAARTTVRWTTLALIGGVLTIAFLSHFGTFTVGIVMLAAVAAALVAVGRAHARRVGLWIGAVTLSAVALSWFVYYSNPRFTEVYQKTYASVAAREQDDSSKITAAPAVKLQRWWSGVGDDYGRPGVVVLATALVGLVIVVRRRPPGGASIVFAAWILAWGALSALGVLTAITLRANLATAPAFILLAGVALGTLSARSWPGTLAAGALFLLIAWDGWQIALRCLDLSGTR